MRRPAAAGAADSVLRRPACASTDGQQPTVLRRPSADSQETVAVTLQGRGRNNVIDTIFVPKGSTAEELRARVALLLGQRVSEVELWNLDNPMGLRGAMRINKDHWVAAEVRFRPDL